MTTSLTAYLAPEGFVDDLVAEIGGADKVYGRLVIKENGPKKAIWAENVWLDPQWIEISSIGDGAKKLKSLQRNWANYAFDFHRRSELVTGKLPHVSGKPLKFGEPLITAPLGGWTLVEENLILASPSCSEPVPNGAYRFEENKAEPPNRAYLKLWEALTRCGTMPKSGETCVDFGSAPGGWTWVLHGLGADVTIIDKSLPRLRQLDELFESRVRTLASTMDSIETEVLAADVVIGAVLIAGASAPKLVTRDMLPRMKRGAVLVDVAIDQGGCFETSRPTTHAEPTFEVDGVIHYCVANMPGAVPGTSAQALNNATLPFVLKLADKGLAALDDDPHLAAGLNVRAGKIMHQAVAASLGFDGSTGGTVRLVA